MNTQKENSVQFSNGTDLKIPIQLFTKIVDLIIEHEKLDSDSFVSLKLCSDDSIKKLNKKYLGRDEFTDVISFKADIPNIPLLGDIIIDSNVAASQKEDRSLNSELQILFLHGLLHLLDYDHLEKDDAIIMRSKEKKYLKLI